MDKLTADLLKGTWCTLLLPINTDNSIDYGALETELDFLCSTGVSGIYSNGTAGEFFNQTEAEFDKITNMLAEKCQKAGMPYQIGVSHMSPIICLERIRRSRHLAPGGFQVIFPDWVAPNEQEQIIFLNTVCMEAESIPLILYSPGHSKTALGPQDYKRLSDAVPELIGLKTAGGTADWYRQMRELKLNLSVFVPGHRLASGISEGVASGSYSNIACINPAAAQQWYKMMFADPEAALSMEKRILAFFEKVILPLSTRGYSDMALDKFLAAIGGYCHVGTRLRWPYQSVDEGEVRDARNICQSMIPELFDA